FRSAVNHHLNRWRSFDRSPFSSFEQPNLLNFKKFVVPMSLEVGRIIMGFESASTLNFKKLQYR
ncbi:hypothetical protein, partial [Pseudomonas putida]|uniref:hypothetical protein n=1 Tax=Pseudomonas putida TaxID=303 RepID=UPI001F3F2197